jgi:Asp/Glu/hydantoin racemase
MAAESVQSMLVLLARTEVRSPSVLCIGGSIEPAGFSAQVVHGCSERGDSMDAGIVTLGCVAKAAIEPE